ncbi:MAG TPA: helicase HerA-like domain-containing protein [bacterium]|jgi:hypothetical protein
MNASAVTIARGREDLVLLPRMANRHGLIAGATGTGKTVTLQTIAEGLSRIGVPIFVADIKGDLSGIAADGVDTPKVAQRLQRLGMAHFDFAACPATLWDVYGEQGHPVRTTVSEMGPLLLGRLLNLNETQGGVLSIVFEVADTNGWLLLDLKDLRALLQYTSEHSKELQTQYGNVSAASVGAIQRSLLTLEQQGGDHFFGEPALDLSDLMQTGANGAGVVNVLAADKLILSPKMYATTLLWLLSELHEQLPEVGDLEKPKLAFFFDEAHLLFDDAPDVLLDKIEQVVRLIRSKGVGVFFITQNPLDVPDKVLGQLGNRVQHALRAFTPVDQKAVKAAAQTFRANPKLDTEKVITELEIGEALISTLDEKGAPTMVERGYVIPPHSRIGALTPPERQQLISSSLLAGHYEKTVDRESAYEVLKARAEQAAQSAAATTAQAKSRPSARRSDTLLESLVKSTARAAATQIGGQLVRGLLGGLLGGRRSRR